MASQQPPEIARLNALALDEIREATDRYLQDGDDGRWESSLARTIAKSHQAAYLLGASDRLGVPLDSPLLNPRNLSRAEREQIKSIVQDQVGFLKRFIDVAGDLSDDQVLARSDLYALAPKQTYWTGWADRTLDCVPGGCEECFGNCRCYLTREADGTHWICVDDHHSCGSCRDRAATWPLTTGEET